jgi:hypothetical protein
LRTPLLRRFELYMRRSRKSATTVGREAARDPRLIADLRRGRELRRRTEAKLTAWLDAAEKGLEKTRCRPRP